jgi:general secretion pathway protein G
VLAILGLLIGLVAPPVIRYLGRAKTDVAKVDIHNLESALDSTASISGATRRRRRGCRRWSKAGGARTLAGSLFEAEDRADGPVGSPLPIPNPW